LSNLTFYGYSANFVLDGKMVPVIGNKTGVKIEKDFSVNAPWNFKFTTPGGIIYLFGGASATESTKREQACGKPFSQFVPNAWYLKEIQHLNGEKIQFFYIPLTYQYDNGVTQTMHDQVSQPIGSGCTFSPIVTTTCVNITKTNGVLLDHILIPGKANLTFQYITRQDCTDQLISKIVYSDPVNSIGYFDFVYSTVNSDASFNNQTYTGNDKTPYLVTLVEGVPNSTDTKKHYFSYIDPQFRPSRLSFAQDHWGYFNGKHNTTFAPYMGIGYATQFPEASANRAPDYIYAKLGLLQKIVYPTGGISVLSYEPNLVNNTGNSFYKTLHKMFCEVTGTGEPKEREKK